MSDVVWTSIIGAISALGGSLLTLLFGRKKSKADVKNTVIAGLEKALDIYTKISDDNKNRIEENQHKLKELLAENLALTRKITILSTKVDILCRFNCMRANCKQRITNSDDALNDTIE